MSPSRRWRALCVALLVALAAGGCTTTNNPATGRQESTLLSPRAEASIGREEHPKVLAEFGGAYEDPALQAYVERVGERVVAVSETPGQQFTFTVLDSPVVNAFALPGGYVYVSRGLLALVEDEAELAGVLGHEIGHVTARHTAQRYDQQVQAQSGILAGTLIGAVLGGQAGAQVAQELFGEAAQSYVARFSRTQELQADELGIRYLGRAGYDPTAMSSFLNTLGRNEQLAALERGGAADEGPSWLRTHPRTPERVQAAAQAALAGAAPAERDRDRYLAALDGVTWGEDPAQGFVRGATFVHPELGFAFEVPNGFRLLNTPSRVLALDRSGRLMIFQAGRAQGDPSPAEFIRRIWAPQLQLAGPEGFTTNEGLAAARARTVAEVDGRQAEADLYAVRAGTGDFYQFTFVGRGRITPAEERAFATTVQSFRLLGAAEAARFRPQRIEIHTVRQGESTAALAARMNLPRLKRETFEVINALPPGGEVRAGEEVKLIR